MGFKNYILVCGGTGCESSKSDLIYRSLIDEAKASSRSFLRTPST